MLGKRRSFTLIAAIAFLLITVSLFRRYPYVRREIQGVNTSDDPPSFTQISVDSQPKYRSGNATHLAKAPTYIEAILNPEDPTFDRLQCSRADIDRYAYLKASPQSAVAHGKKYFFALLLHECVDLLPRLMGSIIEAIRFLGPENCALSVLEGRSDDGTYEVLRALQKSLDDIGIQYFFQSSDLDTSNDRIETLALLRNMALEPLSAHRDQFSDSSTVIFLNDVAACPDDILELIHQRLFQSADMTCAMDWTHPGPDPLFYDVWIARGMTGDTFFEIGEDGNWDRAKDIFWNDQASLSRLKKFKPFQAFACWNGATAFTAAPILSGQIKFRINYQQECFSGEPHLFCKDMWAHGYGKIAVVPSVNLQYTDETGKRIKMEKGYVSQLVQNENEDGDALIEWQKDPPAMVKCMPTFTNQYFRSWNEGLIEHDRIE